MPREPKEFDQRILISRVTRVTTVAARFRVALVIGDRKGAWVWAWQREVTSKFLFKRRCIRQRKTS